MPVAVGLEDGKDRDPLRDSRETRPLSKPTHRAGRRTGCPDIEAQAKSIEKEKAGGSYFQEPLYAPSIRRNQRGKKELPNPTDASSRESVRSEPDAGETKSKRGLRHSNDAPRQASAPSPSTPICTE